jgi:hypothetical protein
VLSIGSARCYIGKIRQEESPFPYELEESQSAYLVEWIENKNSYCAEELQLSCTKCSRIIVYDLLLFIISDCECN